MPVGNSESMGAMAEVVEDEGEAPTMKVMKGRTVKMLQLGGGAVVCVGDTVVKPIDILAPDLGVGVGVGIRLLLPELEPADDGGEADDADEGVGNLVMKLMSVEVGDRLLWAGLCKAVLAGMV